MSEDPVQRGVYTVFTRDNCPMCKATVRWLEKHHKDFRMVPLAGNEEHWEGLDVTSAPIVFAPDGMTYWGGFRPELLAKTYDA